jgi:hypothetical protein
MSSSLHELENILKRKIPTRHIGCLPVLIIATFHNVIISINHLNGLKPGHECGEVTEVIEVRPEVEAVVDDRPAAADHTEVGLEAGVDDLAE